jgi:hypothetical protein
MYVYSQSPEVSKIKIKIRKLRKKISKFSYFFFILKLQVTVVYCVYPAMLKSPKQLPNCLKRAETSLVLIVFRHWLGLPGLGNNNEKLGLPERLSALAKGSLFYPFLKLMQINFIFSNKLRILSIMSRLLYMLNKCFLYWYSTST